MPRLDVWLVRGQGACALTDTSACGKVDACASSRKSSQAERSVLWRSTEGHEHRSSRIIVNCHPQTDLSTANADTSIVSTPATPFFRA